MNGYTIRRYRNYSTEGSVSYVLETLSDCGEFCIATAKPMLFATKGNAVCYCISQLYHKCYSDCWIEGPRGGRYHKFGRRLR